MNPIRSFGSGLIALVAVCGLVYVSPAAAQSNPSSQKQLDIAAAKAQRKAVIGQNMQLSPEEAKAFWPVYDQYEAKMDKVDERHAKEISDYARNYRNMTEQAAKSKLDEVIAVQQARLNVQTEFIPKFRAVLSQMKTTRFFQIDNKLHALIQCDVAQMVPLVGSGGTAASQQ